MTWRTQGRYSSILTSILQHPVSSSSAENPGPVHTRSVCSLCLVFSLLRSLSSPSPSFPLLCPTRPTVTVRLQPLPCVVKYLSVFSSRLSPNLSYLPELSVRGVKTKSMLDGFEPRQSRLRGRHTAVHQILDELFRYLLLHFQVRETFRATV